MIHSGEEATQIRMGMTEQDYLAGAKIKERVNGIAIVIGVEGTLQIVLDFPFIFKNLQHGVVAFRNHLCMGGASAGRYDRDDPGNDDLEDAVGVDEIMSQTNELLLIGIGCTSFAELNIMEQFNTGLGQKVQCMTSFAICFNLKGSTAGFDGGENLFRRNLRNGKFLRRKHLTGNRKSGRLLSHSLIPPLFSVCRAGAEAEDCA